MRAIEREEIDMDSNTIATEKPSGADVDKKQEDAAEVVSTVNKEEKFQFSPSPTLEEIRGRVEEFVTERNWQKFHTPRNILLALVGEVGELSEIFQWKGEVPIGLDDNWTSGEREHLEQELSDVFIYLIRLSQLCNVDLPKAVESKMAHNRAKYPIGKFFGSSKKYNETD